MDARAICDLILSRDPRCGGVRIVAVDGGAGAGKSTVAAALRAELRRRGVSVHVVATDHLLDGWDGQFGFWDRLHEQVLGPLAAGRPGRFDRYDWALDRFSGTEDVPVADVVVVEGVSAAAACGDRAAVTVWVELDRATRERRWSARDGSEMQPRWRAWLDAEDGYFSAHPVTADVVVATADTAAPALRTTGSTVAYENAWMTVREDSITYADGATGIYGVVDKPDFALVIAAENDGFWLVQQYRHAVGSRQWEFCQGGWPAGRSGSAAQLAAAELAEETGHVAADLVHLGRLAAAIGFCSQFYDVFLATGLTAGETDLEDSEQDLVHRWFGEDEVRQMVRDGRFVDGHSVAALALLDIHRAG